MKAKRQPKDGYVPKASWQKRLMITPIWRHYVGVRGRGVEILARLFASRVDGQPAQRGEEESIMTRLRRTKTAAACYLSWFES